MARQKDIFISYGRGKDNSPGSKTFALQLCQALEGKGYSVWLDKNDIPLAVDFQQEIENGIGQCDNFLFIISPHSVRSMHCFREIQHALRLNKRLIPILHLEVQRAITEENMHPEIRKLNWLDFTEEVSVEQALPNLLEVLETDREYVSAHSRYTTKALEWGHQAHSKDLLLRGKELREAHAWLKKALAEKSEPQPTQLLIEFINKSMSTAKAQRIRGAIISSVVAVILLLLGFALYMTVERNKEARLTLQAQQEAFKNFRRSQSNQIIAKAGNSCMGDPFEQLRAAILAYQVDPTNLNAMGAVIGNYYHLFPPEELYEGEIPEGGSTENITFKGKTVTFEAKPDGVEMLMGEGEKIGQIDIIDPANIQVVRQDRILKVSRENGFIGEYSLDVEELIEKPFPEKTLAELEAEKPVPKVSGQIMIPQYSKRSQQLGVSRAPQKTRTPDRNREKIEQRQEVLEEKRERLQKSPRQISVEEVKKYGIDKELLKKSGVKIDSTRRKR